MLWLKSSHYEQPQLVYKRNGLDKHIVALADIDDYCVRILFSDLSYSVIDVRA